MINSLEKYQKWTRSVTGKKLLEVKGLIYVFENPDFEHPQQLQFIFSNTEKAVNFKCDKDGSSLELADSTMQENDLGEYGKEVIMDVSHLPLFINFLGKTLLKVFLIFSSVENAYIGIRLFFEGGGLVIANIGDEINILNSLELSFEKDEGIKFQEL